MQTERVEVGSPAEAVELLPQYFRSFELLALEAVKSNDGIRITELCRKRDAALTQYCQLTGIDPKTAAMSFIQPSGVI